MPKANLITSGNPSIADSFEVLDFEFDERVDRASRLDCVVAAGSGLITGLLSVLLGKSLSIEEASKIGGREADGIVVGIARSLGCKLPSNKAIFGKEGMDIAMRKRLFSAFRVFFRHLPIAYGLVVLRTREYASLDDISAAMRRKIVDFLFDNLAYFQSFDSVKIYYDDGQQSIAGALHKAIDYALSKNAVTYRLATASDYRLSQAADYICTAELTVLKYQSKASTATDEKFFGSWAQLKKKYSRRCGPSGYDAFAQIRNDSYQNPQPLKGTSLLPALL